MVTPSRDPALPDDVSMAGAADDGPAPRDHWLVRDPVRTGFLVVLVVSLVVRLNVLRDSYFITDDFMLTSRAMESPFGWDYLGRVHTGHFEPVGFAVMWVLAHFAPWSWGAAVSVILVGLLIVSVLVWRLLVELFGRRGLALVPFALFCFSPLTLPATTWLSAAIIWIPLMASVAGVTRHHVRYLRTGRPLSAVGAVIWLVVGLLSFEKTLVVLPYLVVLTLAVLPQMRIAPDDVWRRVKSTWLIWAGYLVTSAVYLFVYVGSLARDEGRASLFVPSLSQVWDFTYLSVFRTLIPASVGRTMALAARRLRGRPRRLAPVLRLARARHRGGRHRGVPRPPQAHGQALGRAADLSRLLPGHPGRRSSRTGWRDHGVGDALPG